MKRTVQDDNTVVYEWDSADKVDLYRTPLAIGAIDALVTLETHKVCIMQLTEMLRRSPDKRITRETVVYDGLDNELLFKGTGQEVYCYDDHPICVSEAITSFMINLNDSSTDVQRELLRSAVPDIVGTCPVKLQQGYEHTQYERRDRTSQYNAAEIERHRVLGGVDDGRSFEEKINAVRQAAQIR